MQVGTQVPTPESQETPRPKSKERTQAISRDPRNPTLCPWIPPLCGYMLRGSPLLQVQASRSSDENSDTPVSGLIATLYLLCCLRAHLSMSPSLYLIR